MNTVSLRQRLTALYCSFLIIIFALLGFIAYSQMRRRTLFGLDDELRGRLQSLEQALSVDGNRAPAQTLLDHANYGDLLQVIDESGQWIYRSPVLQQHEVTMTAVQPGEFRFATLGGGEHRLRVLTANLHAGSTHYGIQIAAPMYASAVTVGTFRLAVLVFVPLSLAIAFAGGRWLSSQTLAPLDAITSRARLISRASLSDRLPLPSSRDELYRLAETLNGMLDRLESAFRRITQFTADASHELRTPLALIRTTAEVCERKPRSHAEYRTAFRQIISEVDRTTVLVEALLFLARADARLEPFVRSRIDLVDVLRDVRDRASVIAATKQIHLDTHLPADEVAVCGDVDALERLIMVLVDNAIKFTPAGGHISVSLAVEADAALITVADTGIGIPQQDLPHIHDRFYQVDAARTREGFGLGLAMARSVAEAHGAAITCKSMPNSGTTFTVRLPLA